MDLEIDGSNELVIENGDLVLVDGVDAITQHLQIALRTWKGEWFLNRDEGVPYLGRIYGKPARRELITATLRKAIMAVPGVSRIVSFSLDLDAQTRALSIAFDVRVTTGETLTFTDFVI